MAVTSLLLVHPSLWIRESLIHTCKHSAKLMRASYSCRALHDCCVLIRLADSNSCLTHAFNLLSPLHQFPMQAMMEICPLLRLRTVLAQLPTPLALIRLFIAASEHASHLTKFQMSRIPSWTSSKPITGKWMIHFSAKRLSTEVPLLLFQVSSLELRLWTFITLWNFWKVTDKASPMKWWQSWSRTLMLSFLRAKKFKSVPTWYIVGCPTVNVGATSPCMIKVCIALRNQSLELANQTYILHVQAQERFMDQVQTVLDYSWTFKLQYNLS